MRFCRPTAALGVFVIFGGLSLLFLVPSAINGNEQDLLGNDFRGPVRIVTAVAIVVFAAVPPDLRLRLCC